MPSDAIDKTYEQLAADLHSADVLARLDSAKALGRLRSPRAIDPLVEALQDPEWRVCREACASLGELGDHHAVAPLVRVFEREDLNELLRSFAVAKVACRALSKLGEPGFRALLRILHQYVDDEPRGQSAAETLRDLGDLRAIDALAFARSTQTHEVGQAAAQALIVMGEPAIPSLVSALGAESASTRFYAKQGLRWIGAPTLPALGEALRHGPQAHARVAAAETLGTLEDERVPGMLREALEDPNEEVRRAAGLVLAEIGDASVDATIIDAILDIPVPRGPRADEVANAIAELEEVTVEPLFRAVANGSRSPPARANATLALGKLRVASAVEPLIAILRDPDTEVRLRAAHALGQLKDQRAYEPLVAALHDESVAVRRAAVIALSCLDDPRVFDQLFALAMDAEGDRDTRSAAIGALAASRCHQRSLPLLREWALGNDSRLRQRAQVALVGAGEAGVDILLEAAQDSRLSFALRAMPLLRAATSIAGQKPLDARVKQLYLSRLHDQSVTMRHVAVRALTDIEPGEAIDHLLEALQDPEWSVRFAAADLLERFGDERAIAPLMEWYRESLSRDQLTHGEGQETAQYALQRRDQQEALLRIIERIRARLVAPDQSQE
ncbi:MAG TPA: HEAT repeat domain-containing protein [Ktedonobacterales bacterium]|nr:HEAT repeat domain-containing protein [Ktedonobacterales bacterium]